MTIAPDTQAAFNAIVALALVPYSHTGDASLWAREHGVTSKQIADKYGSTVNDVHDERLRELVELGAIVHDAESDRYAAPVPF
jgi:hypothetical protein